MHFFAGIDGGGTKTRCLIGDEKSQIGAGSSSSCKVQRVGEACAQEALAAAVHEAVCAGWHFTSTDCANLRGNHGCRAS